MRGFGLLEAIVAMTILGSAGLLLFGWIHSSLQTSQRLHDAEARARLQMQPGAVGRDRPPRTFEWLGGEHVGVAGGACLREQGLVGVVGGYVGEAVVGGLFVAGAECLVGIQTREQLFATAATLIDDIVALLTQPTKVVKPLASSARREAPDRIVFRGSYDQVYEHCLENIWTDGLPVVPPTPEKVRDMLRFTDRRPDEVIGILAPAKRAATVWSVAVNGVMAGCRPQTLPVLLALAEAMAEPRFHVEHVGTTGGWTVLILLNGPIIGQLGFHSGQGVMRPQHRANITVSRALRLMLVNIAGYRLGETDMATFGRNYYPGQIGRAHV